MARIGTTAIAFCAVTLLVFMAFFASQSQRPFSRREHRELLPDPTFRGYLHYVWRAVHGDLGTSVGNGDPVTKRMFHALPVTLSVLVGGIVISLLFALAPLLRPRAGLDRAFGLFSVGGISVHPVWAALVLSWLFGAHWHLVPKQGYCGITAESTGCSGVTHWVSHMVLPWLVYGLATGAYFSLAVRALLGSELNEDYVRAARAKGVGERRIVRAHVMPNITPQLLGLFVANLGIGFTSLIFIERILDLPGLGNLFAVALRQHDAPLTAGITLLAAATITVLTLAADLLSLLAQPRPRRAPAELVYVPAIGLPTTSTSSSADPSSA